MRPRQIIVAFLVGLLVGALGMWIYGEQVRQNVAGATHDLGTGVKDVGKSLEKSGKKMR